MKIIKTSKNGIDFIKKYEGFRAKPYLCPANVPTIGYGATYYPNGRKVRITDAPITEIEAFLLLEKMLIPYEKVVYTYCVNYVSQNNFDALVSFAYNLGADALKNSTLLKKVNENRNDPGIRAEFLKYVFAGKKRIQGLVNRRTEEANLYFSIV